MKYYETNEPFYSLIVASNVEEAKKIYREMYGDQDDPDNFKEDTREEAMYRLTLAKSEDGDTPTYEEVKESLLEKKPSMLLCDCSIL
ncbi:hypothetical protein HWN39_10605 [Lactobacillus rhamnosus]|uniref:Uncharacterized protein n=1 Tax=Lacticaseibacillus rhamnosus TaxID=47715 RepID=A0A7Y7UK39_LACRH|nr:hypothetical protein [Lacticaseibacillus rhamnosus]NVO88928.1 hypothetical protein [Lacticaseibacillus rhamnosus]